MASWFSSILTWLQSWFFTKQAEISVVGLQVGRSLRELSGASIITMADGTLLAQASGKTSFVNMLGLEPFSEDVVPTVAFNLRRGAYVTSAAVDAR